MRRRDFLARLAGAAGVGLGENALAYTRRRRPPPGPPSRLNRVAISTWSLHNYFRATRDGDFTLPGPMLALLDVPELIANRYKVHHLEVCARHFSSTELVYLRELRYTLAHTLSTILVVKVDIEECGPEGTFSDPDPDVRKRAIDAAKRWVDIVRTLGVRAVEVGPGKVDPENLAPTAESYRALAAYALARGIHVLVENRPGFGDDDPEEIVKVIKLAGPGRLGALPDFANFPDATTRGRGLKMLFPYAPTVCQVQAREFGAEGAEKGYDLPQAMEIARAARFRGVYAIEFDGPGDPYAGIQKTLDELLKYL